MGSSKVDSFIFWAVVLNVLIRWLVSRFPHSGAKSPPLYGDYEAQRHWMEITYALSPSEWYKNSTENDLQYWGLDYPPLTAYHSWLNGWVASHFNQSWIELGKSRGIQTYHHRIFMRSTVLFTDLLVYFTSMISFFMELDKNLSNRERAMSATIGLLYPALILIDHGHFQYNHMSLGLTLWAINMIVREKYAKAVIFFCLALNYKQISLYYSFPFAFYLLGICFKKGFRGVATFISLTIAVSLTFVLCWLPFLENQETFLSVVKRLFPLSRGLYEDKVANVWCSLEIFIKFKKLFPVEKMAALASIIILTLNIPSSLHLLFNPVPKKFIYALAYSSLVFFLFAFQVHEKSILFAGLPIILLINDSPLATLWFYVISTFSLIPLMVKDHLMIPTCALTVLILVIYFAFFYDMRLSNLSILLSGKPLIFSTSIIGCIFLALVDKIIEPPSKYPHIFILLNSIYSCIHFIGFALYYHSRLFREASYHESLKNKSQ